MKINKLNLPDFNIGILYKLEKGNYIINKKKHFDPLLNLSNDIEDIINLLNQNTQEILNFLFFNMDIIERILYNEDKIIYFDFDDKNNNFFLKINQENIEIEKKNEMVFLYYIVLLIKYNKNIVNFSYSIGLINKINSLNKNININTIYKNILISKIILELINFYKSNQIFQEKEEKEYLNKIEKENINIIEKYINYFEKIGLKINQKELKLKGIELIYAEIINSLLKSKDYDLAFKIIEQLDLENINITKTMFNEISKSLFSNENLINEYALSTFDDLFDSTKIYFYYILFKYILKNPIYIYFLDYLNEARKTVFRIIHSEQNQLKDLLDNNNKKIDKNFKDRIIYVIEFFTNSDYYMKKYIYQNNINILNNNLSDNNEINQKSFEKKERENSYEGNQMSNVTLRYNNDDIYNEGISNNQLDSSSYLSGKKEGSFIINQNEKIINNSNAEKEIFKNIEDDIQNILNDSEITLNINNNNKENEENKKNEEIEYEKMTFGEGNDGITYEKYKKYFSKEEDLELAKDFSEKFLENYQKFNEFLEKIKKIAKIKFINLKLVVKIKLKEEEETKNNANCIKNITSKYEVEKPCYLEKIYQDKNILENDNYEGFISFSEDIIKLFQNKSTFNSLSLNISSIPIKSKNIDSNSYKNSKDITNSIKEYNFIRFKKFIGKHNKIAEKIRELDNKINGLDDVSFISDGYNEIFIYDIDLHKIDNYTFKNYYDFFVFKDEVIISQKNKFTFFNRKNTNNKDYNTNFSCRNLLKLKDNKYILCNENGLFLYNDFKKSDKNFELKMLSFRGGIKITDEIVAITSNSILPRGENKLCFFNLTSKSFMKEIEVENYSFTLSINNCALMKIPNRNNCKLLLFACQKYRKDDKNGILLLKIKLSNDKGEKFEKFYDTKNFEVYCFCPILETGKKSYLEKNDKAQANETEYFFVGGFDLDKNEGIIKLFKVIYDNEIEKIEIKYIRNIIVKKILGSKGRYFEGFKGPISCIIQSSTGEILVTCYDGNVYSFFEPNFNLLNKNNEYYNSILKNKN